MSDAEYWLTAVVVALVILMVVKERVAGSTEPASQALSRRLNVAILPLLAIFVTYTLLMLAKALL